MWNRSGESAVMSSMSKDLPQMFISLINDGLWPSSDEYLRRLPFSEPFEKLGLMGDHLELYPAPFKPLSLFIKSCDLEYFSKSGQENSLNETNVFMGTFDPDFAELFALDYTRSKRPQIILITYCSSGHWNEKERYPAKNPEFSVNVIAEDFDSFSEQFNLSNPEWSFNPKVPSFKPKTWWKFW